MHQAANGVQNVDKENPLIWIIEEHRVTNSIKENEICKNFHEFFFQTEGFMLGRIWMNRWFKLEASMIEN